MTATQSPTVNNFKLSSDLNDKDVHFDDLTVRFSIKHKDKYCGFIVRLDEKDQNWEKVFELIGTTGFISGCLRGALKDHKFISGDPFK